MLQERVLCYRSMCCVTGACVVLQEHVLCYRSVCCVTGVCGSPRGGHGVVVCGGPQSGQDVWGVHGERAREVSPDGETLWHPVQL